MLITDEKKLDTTLERFYNRYNKYNTDVLKTLGNVVKQFDGLTPSQAHQLAQELKIGYDVYKLQEELAKISGKSVEEVDKLLDKVAEENVEFSEVYYKAKNKEYVDYENNSQLQNLIESIKKETNNTFVNISKSQNTGFSLKQDDGSYIYKTIPQVYNDLIDEAVYNVSIGMIDYQSAMRNTLNQLADSGVKVHEEKMTYPSGYNRRIDSSVRQNILTGLRQVNIGVQEEVGKDFGADGIEISAHVPCAEDHIDIQGRQYKKEKFEKLNSDLMRPIGTLNCTHFVFSVVLGVEEPNYTKEQLEQMKRESREKVVYKGKTYTKYEATQVQRRLETAIRQQKDRQIISKASGDKEGILKAQNKITQLTKEYNDFSKSAGLRTYKNRLTVSGYRRTNVGNIKNNTINFDKYREQINNNKALVNIADDFDTKGFYKQYNDFYKTLDKKELTKVNEQYTKWNGEGENPIGKWLNKELEYDKLPELINKKEFWIDEDGEPTMIGDTTLLDKNHWYRGVSGNTVEETRKYRDDFKYGDYFAGIGINGNGTYFSKSYIYASSYSGTKGVDIDYDDELNIQDGMIYAMPKDNAIIGDGTKLKWLSTEIARDLDKYGSVDDELYVDITSTILSDPGYFGSVLGYDIVDLGDHKIILNRASIKVVK